MALNTQRTIYFGDTHWIPGGVLGTPPEFRRYFGDTHWIPEVLWGHPLDSGGVLGTPPEFRMYFGDTHWIPGFREADIQKHPLGSGWNRNRTFGDLQNFGDTQEMAYDV
jgi:hypothetical protein